jgi:hypothetical protein
MLGKRHTEKKSNKKLKQAVVFLFLENQLTVDIILLLSLSTFGFRRPKKARPKPATNQHNSTSLLGEVNLVDDEGNFPPEMVAIVTSLAPCLFVKRWPVLTKPSYRSL